MNIISADAPARAYLSGTRYFNHSKGCSQCDQKCTSVGRRRIYSTTVANLRTDDSFAERIDHEHHAQQYVRIDNQMRVHPVMSILEETGHGMVSTFPLDPMHWFDQGVGKIYLKCLVKNRLIGGPSTAAMLLELK